MKPNDIKLMKTNRITINGIVQGVGFRPFVANLAKRLAILGTVRNSSGTVIILAQSRENVIDIFLHQIKNKSPIGSLISNISVKEQEMTEFIDFSIVESEEAIFDEIIIPPDMAVCDKCRDELFDKNNIRYQYPFISCVSCGARYSIIKAVPYDRERTTMDSFKMCPGCLDEYETDSRRCYAQTISCHNCGPQLLLDYYDGQANIKLHQEAALKKSITILNNSGILALKSIGGYSYICKMTSKDAVKKLRLLKARDNKPFAIMFSDIDELKNYCIVSKEEESLLLSMEHPIVLLERKEIFLDYNICKESRYIGAFLPYTPLHYLLLNEFTSLIVTSANISEMPIIIEDNEMLKVNSEYLSGILYNTREIITPLDDSVTRVILSSTQLIRRSRGYVPLPITLTNIKNQISILAVGGDLKSAFCLLKNDKAYMSQYFGDLQSLETSKVFSKTYEHMTKLFHIQPQVVVVDKHPGYHSKAFGEEIGFKLIEVQHHIAHIYSVMAEHALSDTIGIAFDGTGFGDDGAIWGGEFFVIHESNYKRVGHLDYMKLCGGDLAAKDGLLLECCYLYAIGYQDQISDDRFVTIKAALDYNINTQLSSSMGRLFDVVCSILEIRSYNSFEGECAILLENCAFDAIKSKEKFYPLSFDVIKTQDSIKVSFINLLKEIIDAKSNDVNRNSLALGFHYAISNMILEVCRLIRAENNMNVVALSGGVFANKILLEKSYEILQADDFHVYFNKAVPTNDSGIALGQIFYALKCLNNT